MDLKDIGFVFFATILIIIIIWEIIPDSFKKYWKYTRQMAKDRKKGRKKRYSFSWRFERRK